MGVAALFSRFGVPLDGERLALDWHAVEPGDRDTTGTKRHHFSLFNHEHTARVLEYSGDIRGQVLLVFAKTDDERPTATTRSNQQVRLFAADHGDRVGANDRPQGQSYSLLEVVLGIAKVVALDQV